AGSTVLLVDDEEGVRSYCRRVLEAEGARVVEAADGAAALRLIQEAATAQLEARLLLDRVDLIAAAIEPCPLNRRLAR
ncbi:MAG TPA: hypothetical protein VFR62_03425, partial [Gemmatimonadales bacterium]|nr:hypothetical protein [Gemmatimonadales bacterium]